MDENKNQSDTSLQNSDKSHWILGIFYFNPKDKRLMPPKRTGLGWTINFGNPYSIALFVLIIGAMILYEINK